MERKKWARKIKRQRGSPFTEACRKWAHPRTKEWLERNNPIIHITYSLVSVRKVKEGGVQAYGMCFRNQLVLSLFNLSAIAGTGLRCEDNGYGQAFHCLQCSSVTLVWLSGGLIVCLTWYPQTKMCSVFHSWNHHQIKIKTSGLKNQRAVLHTRMVSCLFSCFQLPQCMCFTSSTLQLLYFRRSLSSWPFFSFFTFTPLFIQQEQVHPH